MSVKPLSYSEFWVFNNNQDDYYQEYVLGIRPEPSREMVLGSIIHSAFEGKDWLKELQEKFFTPNYERTIKKLLDEVKLGEHKKEVWLGKYGEIYPETDCPLSGRADGVDTQNHIIYELKTSKSLWTEQRAAEHKQLTWYSFLYWKQYGVYPLHSLVSMNVENGRHIIFTQSRSKEQIESLCQEIKQVVSELKNLGWWEKRISSYK